MGVSVKFWGVRGSIACPSPRHIVYGGNTSCICVTIDETHIVLDAGTGIRGLGNELLRLGVRSATLLLTHTHWDHINGFPFFTPVYQKGWQLRVLAGHLADKGGIEAVLASQMGRPMFPIPLTALQAEMHYEDFIAGDTLTDIAPGVIVQTRPLNHPDGATGYRIEGGGRIVSYITDTEHVPGAPDQNVLALMQGADLVIYDCTYTDAEFPAKVGWGHSTWQEGVRLARAAGVKRLAIFHHDPDHDDDFMEAVEDEARRTWSGALVARDMMVVNLT